VNWSLDDISGLKVSGLSEAVAGEMKDLLHSWRSRWEKNYKRTLYFDTEQAFKDIGIALPPKMSKTRYVLGWASQAVKKPAMRSQFDGLRLPGSDDPFELGEVLDANHFELEFGQAIQSAYKHGCAFVTVARGRDGEAPVQIIGYSAEAATGLWDARNRRLRSALTITDTDLEGKPTEFVIWLPDEIVTCSLDGGSWSADSVPNPTGRVLCVPVTNDPQMTSPLGRSRLTNSVMVLNDIAVRTMARMEGNAEFYSSPQLAILGVDSEAFGDRGISRDDKFRLAMDRVLALSKDEDGDAPSLTQLQQATMVPHSDMMRTVAMAFAGETGLPPSSLGVIHDQPASAEAIRAAEHDLLIDVRLQNRGALSYAAKDIASLAVMVRDGTSQPPADMWRASVAFADPEFRSLSAEADAVQKLASMMPTISNYPVLLERLFDSGEVARIQADNRRSAVSDLMSKLTEKSAGQSERAAEATESGLPPVGGEAEAVTPDDSV
jgi:hypothetical protein